MSETATGTVEEKWFCRDPRNGELYEWPTEEYARGHVEQTGHALVRRTIRSEVVEVEVVPVAEVTHACPPGDSTVMPCCGRSPFEVRGDRMTLTAELVTCKGVTR